MPAPFIGVAYGPSSIVHRLSPIFAACVFNHSSARMKLPGSLQKWCKITGLAMHFYSWEEKERAHYRWQGHLHNILFVKR